MHASHVVLEIILIIRATLKISDDDDYDYNNYQGNCLFLKSGVSTVNTHCKNILLLVLRCMRTMEAARARNGYTLHPWLARDDDDDDENIISAMTFGRSRPSCR